MNIYATIIYIIIFNVLFFIALNFFAYKTNKAEVWLQAMKPISMKITAFIFAFPLMIIFLIFYIKGVLLRK